MDKLRECRERAGYSQKYVAITLGVAAPQVSKWEAGKTDPTTKNLIGLADLYGVTVDYLLGRAQAQPPAAPLVHDAEEAALVSIYRQLTPPGRSALMAAAEGMIAQAGLRQAGRPASMA